MKLFGYRKGSRKRVVLELDEVTIGASPVTLRRLATFLQHVADRMDAHGDAFGHEHFGDVCREEPPPPTLVVVRE